MKTITLTETGLESLLMICAAGGMKIENHAQEVEHDCMGMLRMKNRGRYPDREDKEIIVRNLEATERAAKKALDVFLFIKEHHLVAEDPEQIQAIDDIINRHDTFLKEDFVQCKKEFDEVFALMENPDYNPKDYLKPEEEGHADPEAKLRSLMAKLGINPDEMNKPGQDSEDN